jgi:hypothetical protein
MNQTLAWRRFYHFWRLNSGLTKQGYGRKWPRKSGKKNRSRAVGSHSDVDRNCRTECRPRVFSRTPAVYMLHPWDGHVKSLPRVLYVLLLVSLCHPRYQERVRVLAGIAIGLNCSDCSVLGSRKIIAGSRLNAPPRARGISGPPCGAVCFLVQVGGGREFASERFSATIQA